jgi:hypothetical protein
MLLFSLAILCRAGRPLNVDVLLCSDSCVRLVLSWVFQGIKFFQGGHAIAREATGMFLRIPRLTPAQWETLKRSTETGNLVHLKGHIFQKNSPTYLGPPGVHPPENTVFFGAILRYGGFLNLTAFSPPFVVNMHNAGYGAYGKILFQAFATSMIPNPDGSGTQILVLSGPLNHEVEMSMLHVHSQTEINTILSHNEKHKDDPYHTPFIVCMASGDGEIRKVKDFDPNSAGYTPPNPRVAILKNEEGIELQEMLKRASREE